MPVFWKTFQILFLKFELIQLVFPSSSCSALPPHPHPQVVEHLEVGIVITFNKNENASNYSVTYINILMMLGLIYLQCLPLQLILNHSLCENKVLKRYFCFKKRKYLKVHLFPVTVSLDFSLSHHTFH